MAAPGPGSYYGADAVRVRNLTKKEKSTMRTLFSVLTAAALCAALLAGCGDTDRADAGTAPTATPGTVTDGGSMTDDAAPAPTPDAGSNAMNDGENGGDAATGGTAADAEASGAAYSAEGLNKALDGILDVETGTAGGSLQTAQSAAALVEFAAACGADSATLGADTKAWLDSLTDSQRENLKETWKNVCERAHGICDDYDGNKGILADAGVNTDFSALDMSGVDAFLNTVNSVIGV